MNKTKEKIHFQEQPQVQVFVSKQTSFHRFFNSRRVHLLKKIALVGGLSIVLVSGFTFLSAWVQSTKTTHYQDLLQSTLELTISPQELLLDTKEQAIYIVIDIRSKKAYERGHIKQAQNIPIAWKENGVVESKTVISSFKSLPKDRSIVIYADNQYDLTAERAAYYLAQNNIQVKILSVGWNEFRRFPTFWLPDDQWDTFDITQFISE